MVIPDKTTSIVLVDYANTDVRRYTNLLEYAASRHGTMSANFWSILTLAAWVRTTLSAEVNDTCDIVDLYSVTIDGVFHERIIWITCQNPATKTYLNLITG